ncbi:LCP family protein required for cell wall assembly [Rhodococcus sp. PvR044]|uniref:LCP family protein n=1 Tax=unclassified Rhodococcus (in: high G+C Gram-positive bacteria) TaxID=192944 RepID=UPI000BD84929|nr:MULTISPECIES: LCP family protein [unclassified Rhodococcus (in: high G+C Gram-positive bacteria)]MBP1163022.1 LCP family protein required for cell wall assembly [Rhodococcus sp. PvR099]PTR44384.1 LytR family transcriptional attenuator [Rhodococcus sp. OK611]SNX89825.1 transcriptional attenuator, LytR family [Rhodococcus sp. OK270]
MPDNEGAPTARRTAFGRGQIAVAAASVLVLLITGFAWRSVDALTSNLATARLELGDGGKDGAVDILMVGTDSRTDAHGNPLSADELASLRAGEAEADNTDTIVLIRVPTDGGSATAVSIPRDSYVEVPGIGHSKINAAFGATRATEQQRLLDEGESEDEADKASTQAGREALIKSVANLTGITVDHYAEVGLLGFVLLTDAVGGVDVCLNNPVDEWMSGAKFPAGEQTLSGSNALSFVRQRHDLPRGDLDRIVRQQVFMASLVHEVISAKTLSNPGKLAQLSSAVQRSVVLDDDWDIIDFAKQLQGLAGGEVKFQTIPVVDLNAMTDYGESIVQVDPKAVRTFVAGLVGEHDSGSEATGTGEAPSIDTSKVTVDVSNDSGIGGLASRVSEALTEQGYVQGEVGNNTGTTVSTSRVLAADPDSDAAKAVAAALGGLTIVGDSSLSAGTVKVLIAADYTGPGSGSDSTSEPTSDIVDMGTSPTPAPPGPAIDAGNKGPRCVN